ARGGQDVLVAERIWCGETGPDLVGNHLRILERIDLRQHDHELITAIPADCITSADTGPQSRGNLPQYLISNTVTVHVVDELESVQVDHEQHDSFPVSRGVGE